MNGTVEEFYSGTNLFFANIEFFGYALVHRFQSSGHGDGPYR
jgi:hypothetical protein